jgi:hypothetical protein
MKYNLTNETYLPETINSFPAAPTMTLGNMIGVSLFYNIIPFIASSLLYYPIVYLTKMLIANNNILSLMLTAFTLTATTPILFYASVIGKHND